MPLFIESLVVKPDVNGPATDLWDLVQSIEIDVDCTCKEEGGLCEETFLR